MGLKLLVALYEKKVTQKELADAVGVSQGFISYLVKGQKKPSVELLKRIAEFLGMTMESLV